jgi:hypothetical protein
LFSIALNEQGRLWFVKALHRLNFFSVFRVFGFDFIGVTFGSSSYID